MLHTVAPLPSRTLAAEGRRWSVERAWPADGEPGVLMVEVAAVPEGHAVPAEGEPRGPEVAGGTGSRTDRTAAGTPLSRRARRAGRFWVQAPTESDPPAEHLELFAAGTDPDMPALEKVARGGIVIAHEPGRRAVVRHSSGTSSGHAESAGRANRPGSADRADETYTVVMPLDRAQTLREGMQHAQAFSGPFRLPRTIAEDESSATFQALPGISLHRPERFAPQEWEAAWDQVLEAWSTAIQHPGELPESTPVHDAPAEVRRLQRWEEKTRPYIMGADLFEEAVEATCEALRKLPRGRLIPAHRELRDEDLLWSPDLGPGLLKVSSAGRADPALDLGSLRACARWNELRGLWEAEQRAVVSRLINDTAYRNGVSDHALRTYEHSALLRLSCQYTFSPSLADAAEHLRAELVQAQERR
ncbi:hypothetical protein [Nesterenkonia lutea]|uniref:Aminoglycoside phosphotransferase domain-containing protein n=1 Tax=Nesterenkonia lutea TaxID=272919 RepID=A0ABR9JBZ9_9MICC|nr:hypothetical protein [Nesterenkonia lutea]MBE1523463.1 hypothetical protein [Nesterenkonia lutea]